MQLRVVLTIALWTTAWSAFMTTAAAQGVVPGTGVKVEEFGDNFEDPDWTFIDNFPKSSRNIDKNERFPLGKSANGRWQESPKRGHPDVIRRVAPPAGGLAHSQAAMLITSLNTGRPGAPSYEQQQDDVVLNSNHVGSMPVSWSPNVVVRVFIPPFNEWNQTTGVSFGMRASVTGEGPVEDDEEKKPQRKTTGIFRKRPRRIVDNYYPGFFIQYNKPEDSPTGEASAVMIIRGSEQNRDITGPVITQTGWWTFGISFTSDGRAHYYASPGVDELTYSDHIMSMHPQGVQVHKFNSLMFNVVNRDDGRTWTTPWIIDDPSLYVNRGGIQSAGTTRYYR